MNSSVLGTVATTAGICAIALTSSDGGTRTAAVGAIAGLTTPLAQVAGVVGPRGTGRRGRVSAPVAELSEDK